MSASWRWGKEERGVEKEGEGEEGDMSGEREGGRRQERKGGVGQIGVCGCIWLMKWLVERLMKRPMVWLVEWLMEW